jgi:hypothetical protein
MNISITGTFFRLKRMTLTPLAAFQRRNLTTLNVDMPDYEGRQNLTNTWFADRRFQPELQILLRE